MQIMEWEIEHFGPEGDASIFWVHFKCGKKHVRRVVKAKSREYAEEWARNLGAPIRLRRMQHDYDQGTSPKKVCIKGGRHGAVSTRKLWYRYDKLCASYNALKIVSMCECEIMNGNLFKIGKRGGVRFMTDTILTVDG